MSYKILESLSIKDLENQVKLLLEIGWRPIGGIAVGVITIKDKLESKYFQTLIWDKELINNDIKEDEKRKKELKMLYKKSL
jgi:hypothetical protein